MAHVEVEAIKRLEQRVAALEEQCQTPEDKVVYDLLMRIIKVVIGTLWLINGGVKYLAGPIGIVVAFWVWGGNVWDWVLGLLLGLLQGPGE